LWKPAWSLLATRLLIGAINGAIGSFIFTTASGGEITFKGIFQAALTGGILGGLSDLSGFQDLQNLGINPDTKEVTSYLLRAVSITGQATIQGAVRELVGGRFRDGFTQGMFQGLSAEISRAINGDVAARLERGEITSGQARVLNQLATFTGSMIRAAANPNDPGFAFAQDYLTQLLGTGGATIDNSEVSPEMQAEIDSATAMYRIAVDEEDIPTQDASVNRLIAAYQQSNPGRSNQDAVNAVSQRLGVPLNPDNFVVNAAGRLVFTNNTVDPETRQQITWMRQAIDAGYEDTAAEYFNNIVERRAAANPNASRIDIANQLMRELGMSATGNPSLVIAPDGNMIQLSMPSLADSTTGLAAMSDANFNRLVEGMIQAGDTEGLAALYATTRGDANSGTTLAQVGATQGISQGALSQGIRAEMIRQRALDAGYDIETFPMAPRPDSPLLPGTTIAARNWRDLVNVSPIDWPDWAQDILVRIRSTGQMVERYTTTPGQQLVLATRDWFILQATGSGTPNNNIRPHAGLRGTSEGGVGSWERAPVRSGGVEYQEQICRVERGLEYYVEGVAFDGYDPARNVLLDSKDWRGYPPADADFWIEKTLDEAVRQTIAARASGTPIEWVVATEQAAKAIRELFKDKPNININVVVVPKK
jgi:hypothetical protein